MIYENQEGVITTWVDGKTVCIVDLDAVDFGASKFGVGWVYLTLVDGSQTMIRAGSGSEEVLFHWLRRCQPTSKTFDTEAESK